MVGFGQKQITFAEEDFRNLLRISVETDWLLNKEIKTFLALTYIFLFVLRLTYYG
jgi:hypothetical protein